MLTLMFIYALQGVPPPVPHGVPPSEQIAFIFAATTEDVWTDHGNRVHFRVVGSAYQQTPEALHLVVSWQARNLGEHPAKLDGYGARVRYGAEPGIPALNRPREALEQVTPGGLSCVHQAHYRFVPKTDPRDLWWGFESTAPIVRVHLRPHPRTAQELTQAFTPTADLQLADAHSEAPPVLSLLRPSADGRSCDWLKQEGTGSARQLGTVKAACTLTRVSLHPNGRTALLTGYRAELIDLQAGASTPLDAVPTDRRGSQDFGFTAAGDIVAVTGRSELVNKEIADPVVFWRYARQPSGWKPGPQQLVHYPLCDAFMGQRSPIARDLICQYLHVAETFTAPCTPISANRDSCNTPEWVPVDSATRRGLPASYAGQPTWTRTFVALATPYAEVVAGLKTPVGGQPTLEPPVFIKTGSTLTPVSEFQETRDLELSIRGPYLLMGQLDHSNFRPQQPPRPPGAQTRFYRLYDLRTQKIIDTLEGGYYQAAFWPADRDIK